METVSKRMKTVLRVTCICIVLFMFMSMVLSQQQNKQYVLEEDIYVDHGFRNITADTAIQCGAVCACDQNCLSFSYKNESRLCQLNEENPNYNGSAVKTVVVGWRSYYGQCRSGWLHYGGSCYLLVDTELDWFSGESNCRGLGSHLVDIQVSEEQQFIYELLSTDSKYWIGLNDIDEENTFIWTSGAPTRYEDWRSVYRFRDAPSEDCVAIFGKTRNWHTSECSHERLSFCKTGL